MLNAMHAKKEALLAASQRKTRAPDGGGSKSI